METVQTISFPCGEVCTEPTVVRSESGGRAFLCSTEDLNVKKGKFDKRCLDTN